MPDLLVYATRKDSEALRSWLNESDEVAWIVKVREVDKHYQWKAVNAIDTIDQQAYSLWHVESEPLSVPSGKQGQPDAVIEDPFQGWEQELSEANATCPWFGGILPGPYSFVFAEDGIEKPGNLARSEFSWSADRYKAIGKPAHPKAKRWWSKLKRYLERSTIQIPWVDTLSNVKRAPRAYVFPDAAHQLNAGRGRDVNPWRNQ
jgi:hypothetical protein